MLCCYQLRGMDTDGRPAAASKKLAHKTWATVKFRVTELELQVRLFDEAHYDFRAGVRRRIGRRGLHEILMDVISMHRKRKQAVINKLKRETVFFGEAKNWLFFYNATGKDEYYNIKRQQFIRD